MPKPSTGTDSDSSRSRVAATSRIDFTPAQTTVTGTAAERGEVGRLVPGVAGAAVHAAEPAGGEHPDAGQVGEVRRRGDRGRAGEAAASTGPRSRMLALTTSVVLGDPHQRVVVEPDPDRPVDDGDRGRDGPGAPYRVLDLAGGARRSTRSAGRG